MTKQKQRRVKGYPFDVPRERQEMTLRTYEYDMPFNYPNIQVWRKSVYGSEFHGVELMPHNSPLPRAELTRVKPGEWTPLQFAANVPPRAVTADWNFVAGNMTKGQVLRLADAFAGVVPDDWELGDDIPPGTKNLIRNPNFGGDRQSLLETWNVSFKGKIFQESRDAKERRGLRMEYSPEAGGLFSPLPVRLGQRLICSAWVKSTHARLGRMELNIVWKDKHGQGLCDESGDAIIIEEEYPIVRVVVIGSACTPCGYVMLEAEPIEEFYRRGDFIRCTAPLRFKQNNLWGMHLRYDQWVTEARHDLGYEAIPEGMLAHTPGMRKTGVKAHYRAYPFTGMSCAVFEIPKSTKVIIQGGSETPGWISDDAGSDNHYSFRTIRTTVAAGALTVGVNRRSPPPGRSRRKT